MCNASLQLRKEPGHEEANRLYVMIEPLKREVLEAFSNVRTGRYHQAILLLKNIIEVRLGICPAQTRAVMNFSWWSAVLHYFFYLSIYEPGLHPP